MAIPKSARVVATASLGPDTRLLELTLPEPLGFVGGQYIIVDSGLVLESGKAVKRAYSPLSSDTQQERVQIAVKRIAGGLGSGFVHSLEVGAELRFSGPWGKFYPQTGVAGPTLVLATDTGVTAALGLVRSTRFEPWLERASFVWLRSAADYFLPEALVRECVPSSLADVRIESLEPVGHPERIWHVRTRLAEVLAHTPFVQCFSAGDGAVNYALLDDLATAGIAATRDNLESFFNMPKKSP